MNFERSGWLFYQLLSGNAVWSTKAHTPRRLVEKISGFMCAVSQLCCSTPTESHRRHDRYTQCSRCRSKSFEALVRPRYCSKSRGLDSSCAKAAAEVHVIERKKCSRKYCTTRGELRKELNTIVLCVSVAKSKDRTATSCVLRL